MPCTYRYLPCGAADCLVVSCGGQTTKHCFDWKGHTTSNTTCTCPHYQCRAIPGSHEAAQDGSHTRPGLIMVCGRHATKRCGMVITYADMLITFERVWAVGLFDVRRRLFQSFRRATTTASGNRHLPGDFLSQSRVHPSATRQKGGK